MGVQSAAKLFRSDSNDLIVTDGQKDGGRAQQLCCHHAEDCDVDLVEQRPFGVDEAVTGGQQQVDQQHAVRFASQKGKQLTGRVARGLDT